MSRSSGLLMLAVLAGTFLTSNVWSQDKAVSREREALRRAQQQVQQIRQEKAALEEKAATLEQDKAGLVQEKQQLANSAQSRVKAEVVKREQIQQALDGMTQEKQTLQSQKAELDQRLKELTAKLTSTERELVQTQTQKKQVEATLSSRDQQVAVCEDKNLKLYQYGRNLIDQCRDRSASDAVLRLEPFTGIKRVAIENLLEEYRDKFDAQKVWTDESRR